MPGGLGSGPACLSRVEGDGGHGGPPSPQELLLQNDFDAAVGLLSHTVCRRHRGVGLSASRHRNPLGRDASLDQVVAHGIGALQREFLIVLLAAREVGITSSRDIHRRLLGCICHHMVKNRVACRGDVRPIPVK